jgi:hypothetical protein
MNYQDKYLQLIVEVLSEAERVMLLQEEVPYEVVKPYLEIERDPTAKQRLTKIFNNLKAEPNAIELDKKGDRIAFPYETKGGSLGPIEKEINDYIGKHQFTVKDYIKGIAFDEKNQRDIKIGKVLTLVSKKEKEYSSKKKGEDLFSRFTKDPKRAQAKKASFLVVFTKDKYDIATMSADRTWESCMDILSVGRYTHYVKSDIKEGTFVAYIIESTDTNIEKPLGRISIKPYIKIDKDREISDSIESGDEVVNYAEDKTYGNIPGGDDKFVDFVDDMMEKVQKVSGEYRRSGCLYGDSDRHKFADRNTANKRISVAIKNKQQLPSQFFLAASDDKKKEYIDLVLDEEDYLEDYEFKFATDEQKKKSVVIKLKEEAVISENEFKILTDTQKIKYINIKLKKGNFLFNNEFKFATDEQKKKSIDNQLEKEIPLSIEEFKIATDEQKKKSIDLKIKDERYISEEELKFGTDEQKRGYIETEIKKGARHFTYIPTHILKIATNWQKERYIDLRLRQGSPLTDYEFEIATNEQKKESIDIKLENGYTLSEEEFEIATNMQKSRYITSKLDEGEYLSDNEFKIASEPQKKWHINIRLEKGYTLSEEEFEIATDEQKKESIDVSIENGYTLSEEEFEIATDEQKKKSIDISIENGFALLPEEREAATEEQKEKAKLKGLY